MTPLEIVAVAFTLVCVWCMVRQNIWTWPLGLVATTLYGVFFYQVQLYGQMWLQAVFFAFNVYGWYQWLYGGENQTRLRVSRAPIGVFLALLGLGVVAAIGIGWYFSNHTDNPAPYFDATLTAFSLIAQFMLTRKWLENWHIWITVDIAYVYLFFDQGHLPTAGLYAVFIVLATMGLVEWKRSYDADHAAEPAIPDDASDPTSGDSSPLS